MIEKEANSHRSSLSSAVTLPHLLSRCVIRQNDFIVLWQSEDTWEMFVGMRDNTAFSTNMNSLIDKARNQILNCWEGALYKNDDHTCLGKAHCDICLLAGACITCVTGTGLFHVVPGHLTQHSPKCEMGISRFFRWIKTNHLLEVPSSWSTQWHISVRTIAV